MINPIIPKRESTLVVSQQLPKCSSGQPGVGSVLRERSACKTGFAPQRATYVAHLLGQQDSRDCISGGPRISAYSRALAVAPLPVYSSCSRSSFCSIHWLCFELHCEP